MAQSTLKQPELEEIVFIDKDVRSFSVRKLSAFRHGEKLVVLSEVVDPGVIWHSLDDFMTKNAPMVPNYYRKRRGGGAKRRFTLVNKKVYQLYVSQKEADRTVTFTCMNCMLERPAQNLCGLVYGHYSCCSCIVEKGSYCTVCSQSSHFFFSARQVNFHCCGQAFNEDEEFLEGSDVGALLSDDEDTLPKCRIEGPQPEPELSDGN